MLSHAEPRWSKHSQAEACWVTKLFRLMGFLHNRALVLNGKSYLNMLEQPKAGLISRFFRQVENRLNKTMGWLMCNWVKWIGDWTCFGIKAFDLVDKVSQTSQRPGLQNTHVSKKRLGSNSLYSIAHEPDLIMCIFYVHSSNIIILPRINRILLVHNCNYCMNILN